MQGQESITRQQFTDLLLNPDIDYKNLSHDELTAVCSQKSQLTFRQVFRIFDKRRNGSFSAKDFIEVYKYSQEYDKSDKMKIEKIEKEIEELFAEISPNKELTPVDFYNMIH